MRDLDRLEERTKQFAIAVIRLCAELEGARGVRQLAWQLSDSAGSVAANHRAMRRARSTREFAAKLQIVNEEVDEAALWLAIARAVCTPAPPNSEALLQVPPEVTVHTSSPAVDLLYALYFYLT